MRRFSVVESGAAVGARRAAEQVRAGLNGPAQPMAVEQKQVSFHDRDNFTTNRVTLAEYADGLARPANATSAMGLSTVWACINLLAGTIASLPLDLYRTGADGERELARDHQLYRILHDSPNADQTAVNFWEMAQISLELQGNAYAEVFRRADGSVVGIGVPIAPERVQVERRENGILLYRWNEGGRAYEADERHMLHLRGFGGGPLGGLSTLSFGRQTFGLARAVEQAAGVTFGNGVRPSGVLSTVDSLTPAQRAEAEQLLQEKFAGAMNAGRPMLLDRDMKWQQLTMNPEDAQMLESRAFSVEEICRIFGVPPHMIGHTEKATSWGTGLEQQTLAFQKFSLRPRLKRAEQALEKYLLSPAERLAGYKVEFNIEGLLRADSAARGSFYREMTGMGAMTINEVRRLENLPPVPGGDVPRMQMQNVPIGEAGQEA